MPDCAYRYRAKCVVLVVGKCLRRSDDNALAGVNTHRIYILHIAYGDAVVRGVAHDLVFNLFPAGEIFFYEDLRRATEYFCQFCREILFVAHDPRTLAPKRETRTDHNGVTDVFCSFDCFPSRTGRTACGCSHPYLRKPPHKETSIFRVADGLELRAEHLDLMPF